MRRKMENHTLGAVCLGRGTMMMHTGSLNSARLCCRRGLIAIPATLLFAVPAHAQDSEKWIMCYDTVQKIKSQIIKIDQPTDNNVETAVASWKSKYPGYGGNIGTYCTIANTEQLVIGKIRSTFSSNLSGYGITDWRPVAPIPEGLLRSIIIDFEPGDKSFARSGRGGYRSASIKLKYRFLLCAGEIQMAYALDRKSLEHSTDYVDRFDNGINPHTVTPPSEPPIPVTVPIALGVYVKGGTVQYRYETKLADVRDKIAGEAVGMGCFTGQTKTIGTVAKLLGPDPKIKSVQVKAFLDQLIVKAPFDNYTLDFPLTNPDVPAPPVLAQRPRAPVRKKAHR